MVTRGCMLAIAQTLLLLVATRPAHGYQVDSQFSNPCHELISVATYNGILDDIDTSGVPLPESTVWQKLARRFAEVLGIEYETPQEELIMVSLGVGTRAPDTDGHSVADFVQLREIHLDPEGQHHHALRAPDDDYAQGDLHAVVGTTAWIEEQVDAIRASLLRAPEEQIITVKLFLDFYGRFDVEVWEPAFRLGVAAHALQDTFTHMLRSADTTRVYHVLNYVDAVNHGNENEERDGMPHSDSLDDCSEDGPVRALARSARHATEELFRAIQRELLDGDQGAVNEVLNKWLTYEPGCTLANNYCDSPWVEFARLKLTGPYLCALYGGSATDHTPEGGLPWLLTIAALGLRCRYLRRWRACGR
jgi:hypothetical protein